MLVPKLWQLREKARVLAGPCFFCFRPVFLVARAFQVQVVNQLRAFLTTEAVRMHWLFQNKLAFLRVNQMRLHWKENTIFFPICLAFTKKSRPRPAPNTAS